jgi:hypothetical protein
LNVAVTVRAPVIATVQALPATEVHPDQLTVEPAPGAAVRVTWVAGEVTGTSAEHPALDCHEQLTPAPVTVPVPIPLVATVSVYWLRVKVAVAVVEADIATVQTFPETLVQPDQLVNTESAAAVAVSVTWVTGTVFGKVAAQPAIDPLVQEIPSPLTVPLPVPVVLAVRT